MSEQVIFSLESNGETVFRVIARGNTITEQTIKHGFVKTESTFDLSQMVEYAKSILAYANQL